VVSRSKIRTAPGDAGALVFQLVEEAAM
jgi:hypothetical protein